MKCLKGWFSFFEVVLYLSIVSVLTTVEADSRTSTDAKLCTAAGKVSRKTYLS